MAASKATSGLLRGLGDLHDQHVKQLPTDFSGLRHERLDIWQSPNPIRQSNDAYIDGRYACLRELAKGQEGSAALYVDGEDGRTVVIKTFTITARNQIPASISEDFSNYTTSWPAEIEASLLVGNVTRQPGYVPVIDYFILQTAQNWTWALVTPYIARGTLVNLAKYENTSEQTADDLDKVYRPALLAMLRSLRPLHEAGLCHDDIKPDNLFIQSPDKWLLGDLGNVRHKAHPWHNTRSWVRQNQWPNCQLNDVHRALKSYLWFLRAASADEAAFDSAFWTRNTAWSRIYWQSPLGVDDTLVTLTSKEMAPGTSITLAGPVVADQKWRGKATERELLCTSIPSRLWTWFDDFG